MRLQQFTITALVLIVTACAAAGWYAASGARAEARRLRAANAALVSERAALQARLASAAEALRDLEGETAMVREALSAAAAPAPSNTVAGAADARVRGLLQKLSEREAELEQLRKAQAAAAAASARPPRDSGRQPQPNWEQRLQQENPEEYARIQKERAERRQQMADTSRDRLTFLKSIPTDGLSGDYLSNHTALVQRVEMATAAMERIAADPDSADNRELRHALFANMHGLNDMMQKEREVIYNDLAYDLGYSGSQATEFVDYLKYVDKMTGMQDLRGRGRGWGGGGGGGGGPASGGAASSGR